MRNLALFGGAFLFYLYYINRAENVPIITAIQDTLGGGTMPRGIRNNNPLNIKKSNTAWQGKTAGTDTVFETFSSAEYGIRAGAKILLTYQSKYGLNTVKDIINRFAPTIENDTNAYAQHVAQQMGISTTKAINVKDIDTLIPLVTAMIKHENGIQPYTSTQIATGVNMAIA